MVANLSLIFFSLSGNKRFSPVAVAVFVYWGWDVRLGVRHVEGNDSLFLLWFGRRKGRIFLFFSVSVSVLVSVGNVESVVLEVNFEIKDELL